MHEVRRPQPRLSGPLIQFFFHLHHAHRPIHISNLRHTFRVRCFSQVGLRGFAYSHLVSTASSRAGNGIDYLLLALTG